MPENNRIIQYSHSNISNWRQYLTSFGIEVVSEFSLTKVTDDILMICNCSNSKSSIDDDLTPAQLYQGVTVRRFCKMCSKYRITYAILSDMHGILYFDEKVKKYDMTPTNVNRPKLAAKISEQLKIRNYTIIVYYCPAPSRAFTYLDFLVRIPDIKIIYTTKITCRKFHLQSIL